MNSNYLASNLFPKILIHDLDGTLKYTYETSQIATSPTQDFKLQGMNIHLGINDDYGNAVLEMEAVLILNKKLILQEAKRMGIGLQL